jgi:hypothetical protein
LEEVLGGVGFIGGNLELNDLVGFPLVKRKGKIKVGGGNMRKG